MRKHLESGPRTGLCSDTLLLPGGTEPAVLAQVLASRACGVRGLSGARLPDTDLRHLQPGHAAAHPVAAHVRRATDRCHGGVLHHVSGRRPCPLAIQELCGYIEPFSRVRHPIIPCPGFATVSLSVLTPAVLIPARVHNLISFRKSGLYCAVCKRTRALVSTVQV